MTERCHTARKSKHSGLCLSYWAIAHGMAAGVMALLGALQPLFTALSVALTGARLGRRVWSGLLVGFVGVAFVIAPKVSTGAVGEMSWVAVVTALLSISAVTAGGVFQKSLVPVDLRAAACIQNLGGAAIAVVLFPLAGTFRWDGASVLWLALAWSIIMPSVIGITLLMWMLRNGEVTKVTALILLVPPLAALQAFLLFDETLNAAQCLGFALSLAGVTLARSTRVARL